MAEYRSIGIIFLSIGVAVYTRVTITIDFLETVAGSNYILTPSRVSLILTR